MVVLKPYEQSSLKGESLSSSSTNDESLTVLFSNMDTFKDTQNYSESYESSILNETQYIVGLTVLLAFIFVGIASAVYMCWTLRRNPTLWSEVFGGLLLKTNARIPRRVRFARDIESTASAKTVIIPAGG
ncbi:hypothetical protein SK128_020240, partial [Halocaridina rubra]